MDCHEARRLVWEDDDDPGASAHLEDCRACRVEARRVADLRAGLAAVGRDLAVPPPDLEPSLLALVGRSRWQRVKDSVEDRPTLWGGAAAAAAAAAFGVIVARRLIRPDLVA